MDEFTMQKTLIKVNDPDDHVVIDEIVQQLIDFIDNENIEVYA